MQRTAHHSVFLILFVVAIRVQQLLLVFGFSTPRAASIWRESSSTTRSIHSILALSRKEDEEEASDSTTTTTTKKKSIFAISDGTGVTAKSAIEKCLAQLGSYPDNRYETIDAVQIRTFTFCRGEEAIAAVIKKASDMMMNDNNNDDNSNNKNVNVFIMCTIADSTLRAKALRMCELSNVPAVDLLGPSLEHLSAFLQRDPLGVPLPELVLRQQQQESRKAVTLSDSYYQRIEAVEFTLKADDGQAPWLLPQADVIILGVSRTGKTPLSVVLSQTMGLKVANIPLVLEVPPPKELLVTEEDISNDHNDGDDGETASRIIDPRRIFCLTIAPSELRRIRTTRIERQTAKQQQQHKPQLQEKYASTTRSTASKIRPGDGTKYQDDDKDTRGMHQSTYNDRAYIMNDLKNARDLSMKHGWTQIDVTGRAVEETASYISELLNERFG